MNNIKELREANSMTRAELARRSEVPARTLDDWENNRRKPRDVYQLKKVADALDTNIEKLIKWD